MRVQSLIFAVQYFQTLHVQLVAHPRMTFPNIGSKRSFQSYCRLELIASRRERAWLISKRLQKTFPYSPWLLTSIDRPPDACILVVLHYGRCLLMIGRESLLQRFFRVIRTLYQRFSSHVVFHVLFRRVERLVVRSTRCWVDQSTCNARNE